MKTTFTLADVAKATGVNKQTVRRRARELGIYDEMKPLDGRGTMVMTAEQASILSDAVVKANPEAVGAIADAADQERTNEMHNALVDALNGTIETQKGLIENLQSQVEQARLDYSAKVSGLEEEIEKLRKENQRLREYAHRLEHAHWWEKRGIINAYGFLPAPSEGRESGK